MTKMSFYNNHHDEVRKSNAELFAKGIEPKYMPLSTEIRLNGVGCCEEPYMELWLLNISAEVDDWSEIGSIADEIYTKYYGGVRYPTSYRVSYAPHFADLYSKEETEYTDDGIEISKDELCVIMRITFDTKEVSHV